MFGILGWTLKLSTISEKISQNRDMKKSTIFALHPFGRALGTNIVRFPENAQFFCQQSGARAGYDLMTLCGNPK
jgi:hypothetical protein